MGTNNSNTKFSLLKGFIGFSLSAWVNAALSLISTPIITRVFSTDELGKIQLFISILNMFLNFSYLGIDQAFVRFYYEPLGKNDKKSFLSVCLMLTGGVAILVMIGILLFYNWLSNTVIGYVSFVVPVSLIISIIANILLRFFNLASRMEKNILLFNIQAVTITFISNIAYVAVALYGPSAENAIVFRTLLFFLAAFIFFCLALKRSLSIKMDISGQVVKKIFTYAIPICPAAILAVANNSIGQVLMKKFVDYSAIGIYSNAVTVANIITIIQSGLNNYWIPFVFENYKTKQKQIIKMHHVISFVIIMFGIVIVLFQELIYMLLIGRDFWASKQIFPLLLISPICYTISETLGIGIRISKKTFLNIPVYLINIVVNIGLCFILLPRIGVIGAAISSATSSVAMLIAKSAFGERSYRCSDNYKKLIIALGALIIMAIVHVFIYESVLKYLVYLGALIIVLICYIQEIKIILGMLGDLKNKILRRNNK